MSETIKFNISSSSGIISKTGTVEASGFSGYKIKEKDGSFRIAYSNMNSYDLLPVGSATSFEDRFSRLWQDVYSGTYETLESSNAKIAAIQSDVQLMLRGYTTTNTLSEYVGSLPVSAAVTETLGSYVSKDGAAASMYSLNVSAGGVIAGYEIGALSSGPTQTSYFDIYADSFRIYNLNDETQLDGAGNHIPIFSVISKPEDGENIIRFNGYSVFNNLSKDNGETVIDGGRIKTEYLQVGAGFDEDSAVFFGIWDRVDPAEFYDFIVAKLDSIRDKTGEDYSGVAGDSYYDSYNSVTYVYTEGDITDHANWSSMQGFEGKNRFTKSVFRVGSKGVEYTPEDGGYDENGDFVNPLNWYEDKPAIPEGDDQFTLTVYESTSYIIYDPELDTYTDPEWSLGVDVGGSVPAFGVDYFDGSSHFVDYIYSEDRDADLDIGSAVDDTGPKPTITYNGAWKDDVSDLGVDTSKIQVYVRKGIYEKESGGSWSIVEAYSDPVEWNGIRGSSTFEAYLEMDGEDEGSTVLNYSVDGGATWSDPGDRDDYDTYADYYNIFSFLVDQRYPNTDYGKDGDSVTYTVFVGGTDDSNARFTKQATLSGTTWVLDVKLHIHGDAIVDGTLRTSRIITDTINSAVGLFNDSVETPIQPVGAGVSTVLAAINDDNGGDSIGLYSQGHAHGIIAQADSGDTSDIYSGVLGLCSGVGTGVGVEGRGSTSDDSTARIGVFGTGIYGVQGKAANLTNSDQAGVYGEGHIGIKAYSGTSYGSGVSSSGSTGVSGYSSDMSNTNYRGIYGKGHVGVYGESSTTDGAGVKGLSESGVVGYVGKGGYGLYTPSGSDCYFEGAEYPFTAAHITVFPNDKTFSEGDIVIANGEIKKYSVSNTTIHSELSCTSSDKRIFGVSTKIISPHDEGLYSDLNLPDGYVYLGVNAVGEGMINVCEINGDIDNGDYITSSIVPGKGQKQDDDILHNYTVAKSLESIAWDDETDGENGCYLTTGSDGVDYKTKMIGCTYHSA